MRLLKHLTVAALTAAFLAGPLTALAADQKPAAKPKPYPLKTCLVTDEKLGEMGEPYVYVHEKQEIKFCCKGCLKDFKKAPAKYLKKMKQTEAKQAKEAKSHSKH